MVQNRLERGLEMMDRVVGPSAHHVQDSLADIAPDLGRLLAEYFGDIYGRSGLDRKSREIVTVAALTALGKLPQLKVHIKAAIHVGCTEEEIIELLMQMVLYAGFPASLNGVAIAKEVFCEINQEGEGTNA
ncbi:carboxymuconolactone decarboxylase family protein [Alicyclobacillus dauci]|uniref:Carboxymuconolactone decarboxylase family protein n=1 Tax=Alicyclobacillus dauci TaxID=1475485 RepID=A0ABY6Z3Y9_9BACL|nr:carboxymuconolactone decarboxylase family protein [Alicyclobacillus dauci]WAH37465.1 carboxymuconolactone decarboxylase family protein [Alicyclobacillus dauci]